MIGSANLDLVVRAQRLPSPGDTVLGADLVRVPGGKGANQAVAAARLGAEVHFVGRVGSDAFGEDLRLALVSGGVHVEHLRAVAERPTGVALIVVDERGENLIAVSPGANAALAPADVEAALSSIGAGDAVLLQLEVALETVRTACRVAACAGAHVLLNAAPSDHRVLPFLDLVATLIVNRGEAALLAGESDPQRAALALRDLGARRVLVTLGADGLVLADGRGVQRVAAHRVEVVDTTAAGDAFAGAFATAWLEGRSSEEAAAFATIAAGLATTRLGAQTALPSRAEVDSVRRDKAGGT